MGDNIHHGRKEHGFNHSHGYGGNVGVRGGGANAGRGGRQNGGRGRYRARQIGWQRGRGRDRGRGRSRGQSGVDAIGGVSGISGGSGSESGNVGGNVGHTGDVISERELFRVDNVGRNWPKNQIQTDLKKTEEHWKNQLFENNFNNDPAMHSEKDKSFPKFRDLQYRLQQNQKQHQRNLFNQGNRQQSLYKWENRCELSHNNETNHAARPEIFAKENDFVPTNNLVSEKILNATPTTPNEIVKKQNVPVKIKVEKTDKSTAVAKKPDSSSSSSSDSSSEEENQNKNKNTANAVLPKPVQKIELKSNTTKLDAVKKKVTSSSSSSSSEEDTSSDEETVQKPKPVSAAKKAATTSSSSSSEDSSSDDENIKAVITKKTIPAKSPSTPKKHKADVGNDKKEILKKTSQAESTEEEVVCLGKVQNKIVVEDEETSTQSSSPDKNDKKKPVAICLLCDKQGHTSFECQMICKNCSEPYHNLKNCPKPANISLVLQSFMEFCMQQLTHYNPEEKYQFEKHFEMHNKLFSMPHSTSSLTSASNTHVKQKRLGKSKGSKKATKKRRIDESEESQTNDPSVSQSDSDSSCATASTSTKLKKKRSKISSLKAANFSSPFAAVNNTVSPYATMSGVEHHPMAATAAFNPMLPMFYQMLQSGVPTHSPLNFQKESYRY